MSYLNEHELQLASRFLFLSMVIIVIQRDIETIRQGSFKIKRPYMIVLEKMLTQATNERRLLRQSMKQLNVRVTLLQKDDLFSTFLFMSQGSEEKRNYFNPTIKKKVENIFWNLLHETIVEFADQPSNL